MTKKIILFALIISISLGIINTIPEVNVNSPQTADSSADPLLIGTTSFGYDLDPANAWDSASFDIIDQISEGLFAYSLINRDLTMIPRLANNYGSWNYDYTEFTVPLRENVYFHNGNYFNAYAVKNSFDRLNHLIDLGELQTAELYAPINGERVINSVIVIDEFTVKFVLNYQYAPFEALLCFCGSYIVDTNVMPTDTILTPDQVLIGTGPYKFIYNDGGTVYFEYFPSYYRGIPAVKEIHYIKYESASAITMALLDGEIDVPHSLDLDYKYDLVNSDILHMEEPVISTITSYMGMNNVDINHTMRQSISYAIDYDYIISWIYSDSIVRMNSVIPTGIMYHKDCDVATYDLYYARQILINAGLSQGLDEYSLDVEWIALAESGNPIASYNYTYNLGNVIREDIGVETQYDLSLIGIEVELTGVTWTEFLYKLYFYHNELNLYLIGWMPDYNDPSNYINPLFSNTSLSNAAQVDDPWLQDKMDQGLTEFDTYARQQIYYDIQDYITTNLVPWVFIGFSNKPVVYNNEVSDFPANGMNKKYYFYCTWWGDSSIVNDPFLDFSDVDSDNDGLPNEEEVNTYGTDPYDSDSDDDGLLDGEEVFDYDTDPLDSDTDNDDYDDGEEIEEGTDPLDPESYPTEEGDDDKTDPFANIAGYPSISVSLFVFSAIFFLIWKSKRKQSTL